METLRKRRSLESRRTTPRTNPHTTTTTRTNRPSRHIRHG